MNTVINNGFLKSKFEAFDKLTSESEQDAYLEKVASEFEILSDDKE